MTTVDHERLIISEFEWKDDLEMSYLCIDDSEKFFASVIGCIENTIMQDGFLKLQKNFMEEYWKEFDDNDENKLIYTDIFKKYLETVEKHIDKEITTNMPDFKMYLFEKELETRKNELEGEIFDMLTTFTDFKAFKTMFLDYRAMKEGKTVDFSSDILVTKYGISMGDPK